MNLLQRIIEHLQNLVLVSDITILLMSISLILMSCAYIYFIFKTRSKYEKVMMKIGILIRILMFIGFTIEFSHQVAALSGLDVLDIKDNAAMQFSNYLFYGYFFIAGVYYVLTIGIDKFKGFFYTFDLTMMSIPLLYVLTAMIFNLKEAITEPFIFLLLLSLFVLPYLFFKFYWNKSLKWNLLFFGIGIVQTIIIAVIKVKFGLATAAFYLLIGLYDICREIFQKLKLKLTPKLFKTIGIISIVVPLILIYSSAAAININPVFSNRKYHLVMMFNKNTKFAILDEAKTIARSAVENDKDEIKLWQPNTEDFHNVYRLRAGDYSIEIVGTTGKLTNIHFQGKKNVVTEVKISDEELKQKNIAWLKSIGYTYDDRTMEMKIDKNSDYYIVNIYRKYSDGTADSDKFGIATIDRFRDGQLNFATIGGIFSLKDYKEIKIDENTIKKSIETWYGKMNEAVPSFKVSRLNSWYDGGNKPSISVNCSNGDTLDIIAENGQVSGFNRETKRNSKLDSSRHDEFLETAINLAKNFASYDTFNYKLDKSSQYYGGDSYILSNAEGNRMSFLEVRLDAEGKLAAFRQSYGVNPENRGKLYSDKDFAVKSSDAVSEVSKLYKPLGIYSSRVKLINEVDENGNQNFKWMVVVIPFRSSEHHIYFADVKTGDINPLMEYKAGVRNAK